MDYRNIFGIAAVIFATGYLVRSFQPANAFPQGPNVSMGSNPIFSRSANGYSNVTVFTNNTSNLAIVTDITITGAWNYSCTATFTATGGDLYKLSNSQTGSTSISLKSGLKVPAGGDLVMDGNSRCASGSISGYYTH